MPGPTRKPPESRLVESGGRLRSRYAKQGRSAVAQLPPLGEPPETLNVAQAAIWRRLARDAAPGQFSALDTDLLAGYCTLVDVRDQCLRLVNAPDATVVVHSDRDNRDQIAPALRELKRVVALLRVLGAELGLSPVARGRVLFTQANTPDPLSKFLTSKSH